MYRLQKPAKLNFYNCYKLVAAVGMTQELSGLAAVRWKIKADVLKDF